MDSSEFHDLPADERAAIYDRAEQTEGASFFDLDAETRGYYYDLADGR